MLKLLPLLLLIAGSAGAQCLSGDCANGDGTCVINSETIYTGSFKNNLPDGQGIFKTADYIVYTGGVRHGQYNGKGTLYYVNGDVYTGSFLNGMRHGEGEYRSKEGTKKSTYYYNALTIVDMVDDEKNRNGIYTAYDKIQSATMSSNKVAVVSADGSNSAFTIYNASTGQIIEKVKLPTVYEYENTLLYLDFGAEYFDSARQNFKMNLLGKKSWNDWKYLGRSNAGDAIFSQYNEKKELMTVFTQKTLDSKPQTIYQYKGGPLFYVNAVAPDLSKLVLGGKIINLPDPKKEPVQLLDYKYDYRDRLVFTNTGDSLFFNEGNVTVIYAVATGQKLGEVPKIKYLSGYDRDYSFSADPYHLLRIITYLASLVVVEGSFDKSDVIPLIDNERDFIANEIYQKAEIKRLDDKLDYEERRQKAYDKKMAELYGSDWISINSNINSNAAVRKSQSGATEVKCTFCNGSGVTSNYVTGQEITQDKNSGRWYHVNLAKTGTCPMCNGTGYRKK